MLDGVGCGRDAGWSLIECFWSSGPTKSCEKIEMFVAWLCTTPKHSLSPTTARRTTSLNLDLFFCGWFLATPYIGPLLIVRPWAEVISCWFKGTGDWWGLMGIVLRSFSFFESSFSMVRSPFSMVKYCLKSALVWSISPILVFFPNSTLRQSLAASKRLVESLEASGGARQDGYGIINLIPHERFPKFGALINGSSTGSRVYRRLGNMNGGRDSSWWFWIYLIIGIGVINFASWWPQRRVAVLDFRSRHGESDFKKPSNLIMLQGEAPN